MLFGPHWFYSAYFVFFGPIWLYSILSSPFCALKFYSFFFFFFFFERTLKFYSVHAIYIGSIQSTLVLFCTLRSHSIHFGSIWSYLVHSIHFDPLQSIRSTLALFSLFCPLVLFSPFCPLQSYSVHIGPIQSTSVQYSTMVLFSPVCPFWSYSLYLVQFSSFESLQFILVHFDLALI